MDVNKFVDIAATAFAAISRDMFHAARIAMRDAKDVKAAKAAAIKLLMATYPDKLDVVAAAFKKHI